MKKAPQLPKENNAVSTPRKKMARSSKDKAKEKAAASPAAKKVRQPKQIRINAKSKEEEIHLDSYQKRPMTPVFAFIQEKRNEIAAMPGVKGIGDLGGISKKGTELFKALDPEEKEERQKRFEEEMLAYKEWQS